jgi:hypothetical protein
MIHVTEIVEAIELSDEQVSYLIRCCGDPTTDSRHIVSVMWTPTAEDPRTLQQILAAKKTEAAARHEAKLAWRLQQASATSKG